MCNLKIPHKATDKFPLYICTDRHGVEFDFSISFTFKGGENNSFDTYTSGDCVWVTPPPKTNVGSMLSVQVRSPKPLKAAISFNYMKLSKEERDRDGLDPFRKENVERIRSVYNEVAQSVQTRKAALRSVVNFKEKNLVLQVMKPDPEEDQRARRFRAMIRDKKTVMAKQKSNKIVFEKVKNALIQTYSHDLKIYREEEAFKMNYKKHLKLAVQGFWIHFLLFYKITHVMTERVFNRRYSLLKDRVKRAKRIIAVKVLKECIARHMRGKADRTYVDLGMVVKLIGTLYHHPTIYEKARDVAVRGFLNSQIVWRSKMLDSFDALYDKSTLF